MSAISEMQSVYRFGTQYTFIVATKVINIHCTHTHTHQVIHTNTTRSMVFNGKLSMSMPPHREQTRRKQWYAGF